MKRVFAAMAAAVGLAACGGGGTTTQPSGPQQFEQAQKPVSPKSVIVGRVVDGATQQPLDGVTVRAIGLDVTQTTNAEGTFKFDNIVAGSSVSFVFEKMGYVRRVRSASTPASAGNSPLEGGVSTLNLEMFPGTCSVGGFVFLPNGRGVGGVTVSVDQSDQGYGESVVTAQTAMDGAFSLSGLACVPSGAFHQVVANWFDENGDMQADYEAVRESVTLYPGQPGRVFLTYSSGSVDNRIVASNIVDGEVAAGAELEFTFALPMLPSTLEQQARQQARLFNLTKNSVELPTEVTFTSATQLRVRPANGSLREGERYRLTLALRNANTSSGTSSTFNRTLEFQVRPLMVMPFNVTVPAVTVLNGSPIAPFGADRFNFNSNDFTVSFGTVAGAVRYEIFARDLANPNFVFLASIDDNGAPRLSTSLPLPLAFDTVPGMSFPGTQPLAFNNTVTFAVAAVDVYGNRSPLMTAMTVNVTDQIPPTVTSGPTLVNDGTGAGSVDAINESSSPVTYRATIRYSEPMDVAMASLPSFTSMASNAPTITWAWDPTDTTLRSLVMTITIPPNGDATGSFLIRGGRDSSGNAIAQAGDIVGSLGGRRELLSNGNFQMGNMCNLSGWTPTNQGSAPAPVAVPNNGAIAGSTSPCAALLGSPPGAQPSTGRARITQDITIPPTMMTAFQIEASARARPVFVYNRSAPGASYTMACRVETTGLPAMPLGTLSSAAAGGTTDVTNAPYSTGTTLFLSGGVSVRVICEADNATTFAANGAYYVDEVSVAQVRQGTL